MLPRPPGAHRRRGDPPRPRRRFSRLISHAENSILRRLVIPARWGSTRFPGKMLHPIAGKPLLRRVWERSLSAKGIARVLIATDDRRIAEAAAGFGAEVVMTSPKHPSGTDRIAEATAGLRGITHVINVQGTSRSSTRS